MLNIDDAMITINARPLDQPLPVSRGMLALRERHDFFLARAKTQPTLKLRIRDLKMAATARRELAKYKQSNGFHVTYERGYCVLKRAAAVALMAGALNAGPLGWMKRHPKIVAVLAATTVTAITVRSSNTAAAPQPYVPLKAITCGVCVGVAR